MAAAPARACGSASSRRDGHRRDRAVRGAAHGRGPHDARIGAVPAAGLWRGRRRVHERARRLAAGRAIRRRRRRASSSSSCRSCARGPVCSPRRRPHRCRARARTTGASASMARRTRAARTIRVATTVTVTAGLLRRHSSRPLRQGRDFNARGQARRRRRSRSSTKRSCAGISPDQDPIGQRLRARRTITDAQADHHHRRRAQHQSRHQLGRRRVRADALSAGDPAAVAVHDGGGAHAGRSARPTAS